MPRSHALFSRLFDYAGLFPPALLDLAEVMTRFDRYRAGKYAWVLGRLVVPAPRLDDVSRQASMLPTGAGAVSWRISALVGPDAQADAAHVSAFNRQHADPANGAAIVDTVDVAVASPDDVRAARVWASRGLEVYCEVRPGPAAEGLLDVVARAGLHAKLRCGGAQPATVPSCDDVAAFLCACVARGVVAKATAGLHHAVTGVHPISDACDAPQVLQLGYLNLVLAAGVAAGAGRAAVQSEDVQAAVGRLLALDVPPHWVGHAAVDWRGEHGSIIEGPLDQFAIPGRGVIRSIGTCSFEEPIEDAHGLALI